MTDQDEADHSAMSDLGSNHLRMIFAVQEAVNAELDDMHDAIDRASAAGEDIGDDEPVVHVLSALLTVAHNHVQERSTTTTPAELALQFILAVNSVAADLASSYLDADVCARAPDQEGRMQ